MQLSESDNRWRPKPGIINTDMIRKSIRKMIKDDVPGVHLDEEEGYEFEQVKLLYLEHLDILKIDHLWLMPALTVLKLTGNCISKIENLESLVNLVDLNLSFNRIEVIENLDELIKLQHLSLFSNLVRRLENVNHLKELKVFTIGRNKIEDKETILHLRDMNLFSLNMADNPCAAQDGFREYIAAFLPRLQYYEYQLITEEERLNGRSLCLTGLEVLEREEAEQVRKAQEEKVQADKEETYKQAFVEGLDAHQLYEAMVEADANSEAFLLVGNEVEDLFAKFKEEINASTTEIFNIGLEQLKLRDKEIEGFNEGTQDAILKGREKQRQIFERYLESKSQLFFDTEESLAEMNKNSSEESLRRSVEMKVDRATLMCINVKKELMSLELVLSELLKEVFAVFERTLGDLVNSFIETAQGHFTNMRENETLFSEQLGDHVNRYLTQLTIRNEDVSTLPPPLRPIMIDKESVNTALASSHDVFLQVIDNREDQLMSRCRNWYQKLCQDTEQEEVTRFRDRVKEIVFFLQLQVNEFHQYHVNIDEDALGFDN